MSGINKGVGGLTVALAVVGSIMLLGSAAVGAVTGTRDMRSSVDVRQELDQPLPREIKVDVSGADLRIEYYSGADVRFEASGERAERWDVTVANDTISVRSPERGFDWFGRDWFSFDWSRIGGLGDGWFDDGGWFGDDDRAQSQATLRLPTTLTGIDADVTLNAGRLSIDGMLGDVDAGVNAGALNLTGGAENLELTVNAGRADVDLRGVQTATFEVSAGRVTSQLAGPLTAVSLRVSAGALELTLPDEAYDLRRTELIGSLNSSLVETSDSTHRIDARVTAGTVTLTPDRSVE